MQPRRAEPRLPGTDVFFSLILIQVMSDTVSLRIVLGYPGDGFRFGMDGGISGAKRKEQGMKRILTIQDVMRRMREFGEQGRSYDSTKKL